MFLVSKMTDDATEIIARFREIITSFEGELSDGENEYARRRATPFVQKWAGLENPSGFATLTLSILRTHQNPLRYRKEMWITMWYVATAYKALLPPERWDAFLDDFNWNPALADDLVEREKRRTWGRRRHLVAVWHQ